MFLLILLLLSRVAHANNQIECIPITPSSALNVMILMDNSWDLSYEHWVEQREFIADMIAALPDNSRVGIVKYGHGIEIIRNLSAFDTDMHRDAVSDHVRSMVSGGEVRPCKCNHEIGAAVCTDTGPVFCYQLTCDIVFEALNLIRPFPDTNDDVRRLTTGMCKVDAFDGKHILDAIVHALEEFNRIGVLDPSGTNGQNWNQIVLLGDGHPRPNEDELNVFCRDASLAETLSLTQMIVYGIGSWFENNADCIGPCHINTQDTCSPRTHQLITATRYDTLANITIREYCNETFPPTSAPIPTTASPVTAAPSAAPTESPECIPIPSNSTMNVMILMDNSWGLSNEHWVEQREFIADMIAALPDNSRVGIVKYGHGIEIIRNLSALTPDMNSTAFSAQVRTMLSGGEVRPCKCASTTAVCAALPTRCGNLPCDIAFEILNMSRPFPDTNEEVMAETRAVHDGDLDVVCKAFVGKHILEAILHALAEFERIGVLDASGQNWNHIILTGDGHPSPNARELDAFCDETFMAESMLNLTQMLIYGIGQWFERNMECIDPCHANLDLTTQDTCSPRQHQMVTVEDYNLLSNVLIPEYCLLAPLENCNEIETAMFNAMLLLDASHSISREHWVQQLQFASQLMFELPINSRVGIIKFGRDIELIKNLTYIIEPADRMAMWEELQTLEFGGQVRPCRCEDRRGGLCRQSPDISCGQVLCEDVFDHIGIPVPSDVHEVLTSSEHAHLRCDFLGNTEIGAAIDGALSAFEREDVLESHGDGTNWNQMYIVTDGLPHPRDDLNRFCNEGYRNMVGMDFAQTIIFGVGTAFTNARTVDNFRCVWGRNVPADERCTVNLFEHNQEEVDCFVEHKMFLVQSFDELLELQPDRYCSPQSQRRDGQIQGSENTLSMSDGLRLEYLIAIILTSVVALCISAYFLLRRKRLSDHEPQEYDDFVEEDEGSADTSTKSS